MNLLQEIKSDTWVKNWSGNWRLPFASLYHVYTIGLRKYIGKNLKTNLLLCEPGVSSNYIAKIVARELKKPCIIATETATKVFKDGDLVEVDADNGVVRKIQIKK